MTELFLGLWFGVLVTVMAWKLETVERGLALYCPTDGQWAWNGECGK
jgi:hypothetical protein